MFSRQWLVAVLCAISLGGCGNLGAGAPLSDSASTPAHRQVAAAPSGSSAQAPVETRLPPPNPAKKRTDKQRPAASVTRADAPVVLDSTTPDVGSPQWEKEKRENERQEQHLKQIIDGICQGC